MSKAIAPKKLNRDEGMSLLLDALTYDEYSGVFLWKKRVNKRIPVGVVAGCMDSHGYMVINFKGKKYYQHRLAFLFMGAEIPKVVDHINGNRSDNSYSNLRSSSIQLNNMNLHKPRNTNTLGILGVYKNKKKYSARITINGVQKNIGTYSTTEEAYKAYVGAKRNMHPSCDI